MALLSCACSNGRGDFIGPRVEDTCNDSWPVCNALVGCILGPESYVSGNFPRSFGFIVTLGEPSTVRLHLYLDNATAAGTTTSLTFNEPGCVARVEVDVTGQELLTESQRQGEFFRDGVLSGIGDHLVEVTSDARASYLLKVDILPARVQ